MEHVPKSTPPASGKSSDAAETASAERPSPPSRDAFRAPLGAPAGPPSFPGLSLSGFDIDARKTTRQQTARSPLEKTANHVALTHARQIGGPDLTTARPGLSVDFAKRRVGSLLGADLGNVDVNAKPLSGAPPGALARTRHRSVQVEPAAMRPDTPIGQALLAHELTHVVQQSNETLRPDGPGPEHLDAYEGGHAPPGMAQYTISCSSCNNPPAPTNTTTFSDVQRVFNATTDAARRTTILDQGIAAARGNASELYRNSTSPPVSTIREQYERETGISISYDNPFIGVSQDHVERAYRAWAENPSASEPPWILLAVWVKEGLANQTAANANAAGLPANDAADARAIYRSYVYFMNLGADVYISHTAVAGADNNADFAPGTGAAHDAAFRAQIARQVSDGRLPRDISTEIDAELTVSSAGAGTYTVNASPRFYELSLMLVDAFYREQRDATAADPRVGPNQDPGLVYMRWNMRSSSFNAFLDRTPNADPDGTTPSREDWAFHRNVRDNEYGQARSNAIRFKYLAEVFRYAYEGIP